MVFRGSWSLELLVFPGCVSVGVVGLPGLLVSGSVSGVKWSLELNGLWSWLVSGVGWSLELKGLWS